MKKILVIALAVVMVVGALALSACEQSQTVTGEVSYESYGTTYGVKVDVTVKGGIITAVELYTDEESGYTRTSPGWKSTEDGGYGMNDGDLGYDAAEASYEEWINKVFIGKTVEEVNAYVATATAESQSVSTESAKLQGATQSSARIIVAVQNALSKLAD